MKKTEQRINVYEGEALRPRVVARVRYNSKLDYWDGKSWSNGGAGMHKGITRLEDGRYVILVGSQWQGVRTYGHIVSPIEALMEITSSGNEALLNTAKFQELKELQKSCLVNEDTSEYEVPAP